MKKIYLILALCGAWVAGMACTNFLVGKDASVDGSTMVSYAADSYALYGFLHFVYFFYAKHFFNLSFNISISFS